MMKLIKPTLLSLLFLSSCNEFSDRNIDQNQAKSVAVENTNEQLLGNLEKINEGEFSREKMIANVGTFVMSPTVQSLKDEFTQFSVSYNQFCQTIEVLPELKLETLKQLRIPVQKHWKKSMTWYHRLAAMNFGPGKDVTSTAMNSIYSYDSGSKCTVENSTYNLVVNNKKIEFFKIDNYAKRGMGSIEHLIFSDPTSSACPNSYMKDRNPDRVEFGDWFRLGLHQRQKDFCQYNKFLLADIAKKVDELYRAWSPNDGHFTSSMLVGEKSSIEWLNDMTAALFTLDTVTKDQKLTFPAGLDVMINGQNENCGSESCPNLVEHKFSGFSLNALLASLEGFRALFFGINPVNGQNGMGYDDFLIFRDQVEMVNQVDKATLALINKVRELSKTTTLKEMLTGVNKLDCLSSTSEERKVEACALIADIRVITNFLKFELTNALQEVSVPKEASGDND